jgi:hypothetical protein
MTGAPETTAAIVARMFRSPTASLGSDWVDSVQVGMSDTSLHRLVVSNGTPSAAKTRDMYGHFRTKTQMKHTPGRYWKEAPAPVLSKDALDLNDPTHDPHSRLHLLRTGNVGGLLVVTQLFDLSGPVTAPFITILAAPSVATYRQETTDQGIILDDVWDDTALQGFAPTLVTSIAHCPILAAQEGYSRDLSLSTQVESILLDSQPLLLPEGELIGQTVQRGGETLLRTFLLPEVCNLPLGIRWPLDIGFSELIASVRAALGKNSPPFEAVLLALKPTLEPWLTAVAADHQPFLIASRQFLPFYDLHFPDIATGIWPESAPDPEAFSPMLEMLNGFVWRLWCDKVLTTATVLNRNYLKNYLQIGEAAITTVTYLGAAIPGRFCPNFAYHFKIDGWPTDSTDSTNQGFLSAFEHLPLISWHAQQHDRIPINLHQVASMTALLPLQTREQLSSAKHKANTPAYTMLPQPPPAGPPTLPPPMIATAAVPPGPSATDQQTPQRPSMPPSYRDWTPSPARTAARAVSSTRLPTNRQLQLGAPQPAETRAILPAPPSRYNPLTATVYTLEGRAEANDIFINCCRLATHHSTRFFLIDTVSGLGISPDCNLFVREPCRLFRIEILKPLQQHATSAVFLTPFHSFMDHLLRKARMDLTSIFNPLFFTGEFLHSLFSVESWMVSPHLAPLQTPAKTFHVYNLIPSLRSHSAQTALQLPPDGISLMDAKHIGVLTYHLFAMIDLTDSFEDTKFRGSLFGQRLRAWSDLPDNPSIHAIWQTSPKQTTYFWLQSLQSLCFVFQTWIKNLRYHPTQGFLDTADSAHRRHLILDGTTPSPVPDRSETLVSTLLQYDVSFAIRWYQTPIHDASWTNPTPPGHFPAPIYVPPPAPAYVHPPPHADPSGISQKKQRLLQQQQTRQQEQQQQRQQQQRLPKDFVSNVPLLESVIPLRQDKPVSTQLLDRIPKGIPYPKFPDPSGTCMTTICFRSAFAAPQNCCATSICKERRYPKQTRFHVDLSVPQWKSKPEAYWAPLVAFLVDPQVSPILRPSAALKQLTPSTNWP